MKKKEKALVLHAFSDLSKIRPMFFVRLLQQSYVHGGGKAVLKFQTLRQQVIHCLSTAPLPGPASYTIYCLNALLLVNPPHNEGLSHLMLSALNSSKVNRDFMDDIEARKIAARLFVRAILGIVALNDGVAVKLATVFNIKMEDIEELVSTSVVCCIRLEDIKRRLESLVLKFVRSRLFSNAVDLLKQFSLEYSTPKELLSSMIQNNRVDLAESWSVHMGKEMISSLVDHCLSLKLYKNAYNIVERHGLKSEFPNVACMYKKSLIGKLARKGCWDIAEKKTNNDPQLVKLLVDLAYENGDPEMVAELCGRHHLPNYYSVKPLFEVESQYLELSSLMKEENIVWVDTKGRLGSAQNHFAEVKLVGVDCEWSPGYLKGKGASRVSILQIAAGDKVYIFDLISLFEAEKDALDSCLKFVFHSSCIIKLGYAFHNDLEQLFYSFKGLECFNYCEAVLDLQKLTGTVRGGLSALAKNVLGGYLNKTRRMSNWEQRPLIRSQLHYAALDAAVLIAIFNKLCGEISTKEISNNQENYDWHSQIMCCRISLKSKKATVENRNNGSSDISIRKKLLDEQDACISLPNFPSKAVSASDTFSSRCISSERCAPEEELVHACCELFGLSRPGILKSELQHYAQISGIRLPTYTVSQLLVRNHAKLYYCTVNVGSMCFYGRPARSKKAAEYWAALQALSYILKEGFLRMNKENSIPQNFKGHDSPLSSA